MRTPSEVSIRVATPTSLPSLSLRAAPADSGAISLAVLAHPVSAAIATPSSHSRLTVASPLGASFPSVELRNEPRRLVPELGGAVELDLLVTPDRVGQLGDRHGGVVVGRAQLRQDRLDHLPVFADEVALEPADHRVAENIERRPPK